jgi:type IV secretory pathway VirB10-like protein
MNRPLALIEGNLALPNALPLNGLPPPFGSTRRSAPADARREPQRAAPSLRNNRIPPGVKFLFFYKLPQARDLSHRFHEQLADARCNQEMNRVRPRSSRSDHVLGAAIFVGCSIALAWLLATCTTHSADDKTTATVAQPDAYVHGSPHTTDPAKRAPAAAQDVKPIVPTAVEALPKVGHPPAAEVISPAPKAKVALPRTPVQMPPRLGTHSAARASVSAQPEWTTRTAPARETADQASLLDWAAQQRRANIATRATVPAPLDSDWSAHITQRRITDDPRAFHAGSAQN